MRLRPTFANCGARYCFTSSRPSDFGLKVGMVGTVKFEARIKELVENLPDLATSCRSAAHCPAGASREIGTLHRRLLTIVRDDEVCRRLMTVPGVGPVVALTIARRSTCPLASTNPRQSGRVWADVFQVSIGRDRSERQDITLRGRDDAGDALRSSSEHVAFEGMVLAQTWAMQIARRRGIKRRSWRWGAGWPSSCTASGLTAPSSAGTAD